MYNYTNFTNLALSSTDFVTMAKISTNDIILFRRYNVITGAFIWDGRFTWGSSWNLLLSTLAFSDDGQYSFVAAAYNSKSIFYKLQNSDGTPVGNM
jgi:hypothetical protein